MAKTNEQLVEMYNQAAADIEQICKKYPDLRILAVIESDEPASDSEDHLNAICGEMCPICANSVLVKIIIDKNLRHIGNEIDEIPGSERRH